MVDCKRVPTSEELSFEGWNFEFGPLDEVICKQLARILKETLDDGEYPISVRMPVFWPHSDGAFGPRPADPMTIYVGLPFCKNEQVVEFQTTLGDLIDEAIELYSPPRGGAGVIDPRGLPVLREMAAGLRALADRIDAACKDCPPE